MSAGGIDAAAVEVDNAPCLAARENDAPVKGVAVLGVEQAETSQEMERMALRREMTAQARAGGVADPQFFDRGGIVQSALLQIVQRLGVAIELLLIESGGFLEHNGRGGGGEAFFRGKKKEVSGMANGGSEDKTTERA